MELLDAYGSPIQQTFAIAGPPVFSLGLEDDEAKKKIISEDLDKVKLWENAFTGFFGEYNEMANNYRQIVDNRGRRGFPVAKTSETTRAVNTLANMEFRMLTATDPYIQAYADGLKDDGSEIAEEELYAVVRVLMRQAQYLKFKKKLIRGLRSGKLFGTVPFECPFVSLPYSARQKSFEGTDLVQRTLLQFGFDPYCYDIELSDYVFTVDYVSKYRLLQMAQSEDSVWDLAAVNKAISDQEGDYATGNYATGVYNQIQTRKQRAGYVDNPKDVYEIVTVHGPADVNNPLVQKYWASEGREDDPRLVHFTRSTINGQSMARFHVTPYGNWRHTFKIASMNEFELEPIGYGVGRLGKRMQIQLDATQSRMDALLKMALYGMWKIGKYSGYKAKEFQITPLRMIELNDISQLEAIKPHFEAIVQGLQMQGSLREEFRQLTGAKSIFQSQIMKGSATETGIAANEGSRDAEVMAEITADSFFRDFFETAHINNTDMLDSEIYVTWTGLPKPISRGYNRWNLPRNVGLDMKLTTDKDAAPARLQNILQFIQTMLSTKTAPPNGFDIAPYMDEYGRLLGMNPKKFKQKGIADQLLDNMIRQKQLGQAPGDDMGGGANLDEPGSGALVPTDPYSRDVEMSA